MIPRECKRLAEVDFPIAAVSRHSAREKSIRHGHPSTLHLWWARRPLAACRAVLMGLLLPDPCDPHCPAEFRTAARRALKPVPGIADPKDNVALRKALLQFIADFANWDHSAEPIYLDAARALVRAAHGEEAPLVVDPFAGGGSIPLEALRVGCDAFASDLNPVACLILKVMLEDIPRHGTRLADELRRVGAEIKATAEKELAQCYPPDPDGARPIAYLWARTVRCESPNCGAEIPLTRSFWLCKRASRRRALRYEIKRPRGKAPLLEFEVFQPESESDVPRGTVARANATCPCCHVVIPAQRVRIQLSAQHGGADAILDEKGNRIGGALLLAVVTHKHSVSGRQFRLSTKRDYNAVSAAQRAVAELPKRLVPDEPVDQYHHDVNRLPMYGAATWGDAFSARQKLALATLVSEVRDRSACLPSLAGILGTVLARCLDYWSAHATWAQEGEFVRSTFGRQAIAMVWDYAEVAPWAEASGGFHGAVEWVCRVIEATAEGQFGSGQTQIADARDSVLPADSASVWFTDPPYYEAVGYSYLSDYFYVWEKRALAAALPSLYSTSVAPKQREIIVDDSTTRGRGTKDRAFFESAMAAAFARGAQVVKDNGLACVVFAHKTTEGWEALLSGMASGGWTVCASWPITTERPGRLRAQASAALSASVHLICRPRPADAPTGGWEDIMRELPVRISSWMERLSGEAIRGADLVFSCIGPAMELFSRYPKVENAEGEEVGLAPNPAGKSPAAQRGFLSYVWEAVGRAALRQVLGQAEGEATNSSAAAALEEDARLTALFLWTLQSTANDNGDTTQREDDQEEDTDDADDAEARSRGRRARTPGFTLIYDIARRFTQPLHIKLDDWKGRVVEIEKGIVRLLSVSERSEQLFGAEGAAAMADALEQGEAKDGRIQLPGFEIRNESTRAPAVRGRPRRGARRGGETGPAGRREPTTLDRVHAAMLLQASGQSGALRALLEDEQRRGPDFFRLANALSALYPKSSEEKRLVDAMLVAVPR